MTGRRIWIDMTDMAEWTGQHGGTQRVVYGIAEEYYKSNSSDEVGFFVFDPSNRKFYAFDFEVIRIRVAHMVAAANNPSGRALGNISIRERIIKLVPNTLLSNDTIRRKGKKLLKTSLHIAKGAHKKLKVAKRSIGRSRASKTAEIIFKEGDVVFLPGKPWDTPALVPTLADLKQKANFKIAALIYDMIIPLYPHLHTELLFKDYTQFAYELAQCADILLPISKSTAKDFEIFCERLSLECPRQQVIRIGDRLESVKTPIKPSGPIADKFLLCVGTVEVRKNHALLYYTYKLAQERGIDLPQLVIVGRPGWNAWDTFKILKNDQSLSKKILIMQSVSDPELAWLYKNCSFTIYPSMYEGWGLPVAESIQYGKAVASSNASSMPEIAGDLIRYFSPYSADEALGVILAYLDETNLLEIEKNLKKHYRTTEWAQTFKEVSDAIKTM